MRASIRILAALFALTQSFGAAALAQQLSLAPNDCPTQVPDSVQINWVAPCESGNWLYDAAQGCRMWDWRPDPSDKAEWSGACPQGKKQGRGVLQWLEHGQRIDRFEGTFLDDRREGYGRYDWNETDRFEGRYVHGVPEGFGTAHIAGEVFAGDWHRGCLRNGERVVAIGVPRRSCGAFSVALDRPEPTGF